MHSFRVIFGIHSVSSEFKSSNFYGARKSVPFFLKTHDNLEHLAMMERILGPLSYRLSKRTRFISGGRKIGKHM